MGNKKTFLAMLIILILITMGAAWASDNHTADDLSTAESDMMSVDNMDGAQKDTPLIKENLTSQMTEDTVQAADSESNKNGEILGANNDENVLGADESWTSDRSVSSETKIKDDRSTINGNGFSITATGTTRFYTVSADDVTFMNIKFIGGKTTGGGGAVYISEGCKNTKFINCTFQDNIARNGGAVYGFGASDDKEYISNILFENCKFIHNTATNTGQTARQSGGGAIHLLRTTNITLKNCYFDKNNGGVYGGGLLAEYCNKKGFINVNNCNFTNNIAGGGCALRYSFSNANLNVNNCIFENSSASFSSGAIGGGDIQIPSGEGVTHTISNSKFINSDSKLTGGAIHFKSANLILINSSFINTKTSGNGAAISVYEASTAGTLKSLTINCCNFTGATANAVYINNACNVSITNSKFENNAANEGSAIYFNAAMTAINIKGTNFTTNKATSGNGGAIYVSAGSNLITIDKCNFTGNNATSGSGGAIYFQANINNAVISNSVFDKNTALSGGAIQFESGSSNEFNNIDFIKSDFTNNKATGSAGGAAITFKHVKDVDFDNCIFDANVAAAGSGALYFDNYNGVHYNKCTFTNNRAANGGTAYYKGQYYMNNTVYEKCVFDRNTANDGGVIYNNGQNLTIKDSNFTNNNASNFGGVIYGQTSSDYLKISNSKFDKNIARNVSNLKQRCVGGVIYTLGNHVNIASSNFTNNGAWSWGGVIMMGYTNSQGTVIPTNDLSIDDCKFINNGANHGGVVNTFRTSNVRIIHSDFDDNYATAKGGALFLTGDNGLVDDCTFTGNTAVNGSAIIYIPPPVGTAAAPTKSNITNCVFTGNIAEGNGTLWFESSQGKISNCKFTNNTAEQAGGIMVNTKKVTINQNNFVGNNATNGDGGAIYVTSISDDAAISYSNFTNNKASGNAGAIYFASDSGSITNSRFINNTAANGGAIVIANDNIGIYDSYFLGNNATVGKGGAVYAGSEHSLKIDDSTFKKNTAYNGGAVYYDGTSSNGLIFTNDTFEDNVAKYNGGAVYYMIDASTPYRDYNLFEEEGKYTDSTSKRVDWTHGTQKLMYHSVIKGNIDYYMALNATSQSYIITATVTVPSDARKSSAKIYVTIVTEDGQVIVDNKEYTPSNFDDESWYKDGNYTKILISIDGEQEPGNYTVTLSYEDEIYDRKEQSFNFTVIEEEVGPFTMLQRLIDEAYANATRDGKDIAELTINGTFEYSEKLDKDGQINITKPIIITGLTLNGQRTIIDARGFSRIFDITGENVTITNIVFRNGNSNGNRSTSFDTTCGGAILWTGSNGLLSNSNFRYNNASYGGAVFVRGYLDKIDNCEFQENVATYNGGAIDWNSTNGNLTNSRLFNNNASCGGAVFVGANGGTSHIYNCNFTNNNATLRGGAVDWYASSGDIIKSKFENNRADYGGAVFVGTASDHGTIINSTFTANHASANGGAIDWNASYGNVSNSYFYDNTAGQNGGAIFVGANATGGHILNSLFEGNNATNGRGGAVDWYASAGDIEYSNFTDNHAAYGGAVFVGHQGYGGNITNSRFIKNTASVKGGAVDWNATSGSLRHSYFKENEAQYGGALFVGSHSTSGSAFNNTYIANKAAVNGGAIDLNTTGGYINGSRFYNNTAAYGGAVFVGSNTTSGHIVDSLFDGNNATQRGGAVDWYASSGEIYNSNFNNNYAPFGGAVFVGSATNGGNITLSNFTNNRADENGGAIDWNASNGRVKDSLFKGNEARFGGAIYVGSGGDDGHIIGSEFTNNNAVTGGAVYLNNVSNIDVSKSEFNTNTADKAGAIYVSRSSGAIANSTFDGNGANGHAADICIDENSVVSLYNLTITNTKASESSIYVDDSNVTVKKSQIKNWQSDNAIVFNNGNSTVIDTNMTGAKAMLINSNAEVHLTNVINDGAQAGDYSVYNNGKLYLNKNNFTNVIVNVGTIETPTTTRILDNDTLVIEIGQDAILNASIVDDNNNTIIVPDFKFLANTTVIDSTNDNKNHYGTYASPAQGVYIISADNLGLNANTIETGVLKVKDPNTSLEVNITQEKQGEIVVIKATVKVNGQAKATGNVTFTINGHQYHATIINTTDLNNQIAVLRLSNLTPDTYFVTATYNGDDTHFGCVNDTELFIVNKRDSNVTVVVDNVVYGNNATAVISSTASNGTVTIYVNGKKEAVVELVNGKYNYDLGKLDSGNYTVTVLYADNTYYTASDNTTTFEVYEYDIKVEVNETQFNESATIKVTINPVEAQGKTPVIYVDGVQVTHVEDLGSGVFIATTDKLTEVKEHNVNVTYEGNGTLFPAKEVTTTFNVTKAKDYAFDITVTPQNPKFGENVTVNITGPAGLKVNVTIDDDVIEVTLDENGSAIIKRDNLTAGPHTIKANTTGNENFSGNAISEDFTIDSATPQMTINVTQPIAPTSPANVTVTIGKNATGTVVIYIDGKIYDSVEVKDGVAIVPLDTTVPGNYTVTAKYYSDDDNYKSASNMTGANYTVDKYDITMTNTTEVASNNSVKVTVNVNGTADGNVTIKLQDGTTKTVDVKDGVAVFDLGIYDTQGTYKYNVTYNGDKTFNNKTLSGEFTVGKLTNGTINVTVEDTQFGDNATITIRLPSDAIDGTLTVKVNDTLCTATPKGNGVYEVVTKVYPVGNYPIVVTYTGDSKYADMINNTEKVNVVANSSYSFNITVTPQPVKYGENVTINITGPAGENVTVYIDGVNQTVTLDENGTAIIKRDNLTAGPHSIKANITGDENYTTKEISESFSIDQQTPSMEIIVPETIAPTSQANVTVIIGKNATGKVIITVDGVPTSVNVINGTAVLPLNTTKPGVHNITAEYFGDGNYTAAVNNTVKHYTIEKYNTTISVASDVASNNRVTVTVNVNSTAGGNVTIFDENGNEIDTLNVTDGVVVFDLGVFDVQKGYDLRVVYNGDKNFNGNESTAQFTVGKLTNGTINVTVEDTQFGDNATITIRLPSDATGGTLTVKVNDTLCTATPKGNGVYEVVTKVYPVGNYPIVVTYTGDSKYADMINNTEKVNVVANSSYPFKVEVNTAPYGENTTINVTGPAGVNVTVYVDDVPYNVTINENGTGILKLDNITAGHHTITANFTGDDNYTTKEVSKPIDIVQQTPDIQIIVPQTPVSPNSTTNVTVIVGKNATGRITIKINDNITTVDVINGTAVLPIKNIQPGTYAVTAEFYGDSNYNGAVNDTGISFTVNKYDPAVIVETPVVNDNNSVSITVRLNNTAGGKVNITINGVTYNATVTDGVAVLEIAPLANGTYNEVINYSGDGNFNGENDIPVSFEVSGLRNFNVTIDITEGKYGENTTITVHVPAGADGNVTIYIDGKAHNATINPADGTATIELPLSVGDHTINATFTNSSIYADKNSTNYNINIEPQDVYDFNVTVAPAPFGNDTVITVNGPAGLKVNVTVDDEVYELTIRDDGTVELKLNNLTAGKHDVSIVSEANDNYTANANSTQFTVPKQAPEMDITISEGRTPNENVTVTVKVGDNATGVVSVTVDGKLYDNVEVKDGVAQFNVTGLKPNEHTIDVKYLGDDNYNASDVVSEDIKMDKYASTVEVRNWERDKDNNVIVSVYVSGDDGNVTIKVGDKTYNATVNDGVANVNMGNLPVVDTIVNVTYTGDENYAPANATDVNITALQIVSYPLPVEVKNITYGGDATVKVTLPEDWSGDLRFLGINVDGDYVDTSDYHVDGNVVTVTIKNPKAGEHAVDVSYEDGKYAMLINETSFSVDKAPIESSDITVSDTIEVGQPLNVTVDLPKDANGTITVDVNGTKYVFDVVNGSANISIPKLGNGTYKVNITYSGDDNYDPIPIAKEVTVNKVDPEIKAETSEIKLGEPAIIDVTLPDDATGTVTIKVGNVEKTVPVAGGLNHISVENIPVGENQTVIVTYNGNDKYAKDTITTNLTVKPQNKTSDEFKVDDKGNGTIIVTVPENATGNITIKIGNETYEVPIEDGKAVIDIANETNQTPGVHDVTISYTGDGNNTPVEFNSTANVPKWESEVNVNIPTIREGDIAKVNVTVTSKDNRGYVPNGTVRVEVDGKGYFGELINGNVIVDVPGLGNGTHTVKVTYDGNDYYLSNSTTETVTVQEAITVKVNGTGNSSEIVVKLPEDATQDQVEVFIDGKNETDRLTLGENGTAKVNLTGIEPGVHNVTIKYTDEDGTVSYVNTTVNVPKWSSSVNATAATIREGDPAVIKVKVSPDMQGEVKVVINGTGYIADVDENGEATITAYSLKAGNHTAVVTYLGSDKYEPSNATFKLTVQAPITVEVNGTGNGSEVIVKFPEGTTKDQVNVTIDGKDANDRVTIDENGTAKVNLTGIEPGEHNITIKYTDEDGTVSWVNTTVNVPKWSSSVNATAATIREGDPAVIKVKVSPDMQGEVKVVINGTGYIATVDENGEATITAYGLKAGEHSAVVTYLGSDKYEPSNATFKVTVQEPITVKINGTGNGSEVVVKFPEGTTKDQVNVTIDGKDANDRLTIDENGTAKVNLTGIEPGEHNITIKYTDEDGTVSWVNTTVNVPKWSSSVNATAATIREGDPAVIKVKVSPDMQGEVKVVINGTGYIADVDENGEATITAYGLKAGEHSAVVTYLGSDKYEPSNATFKLTVQAPITVEVNGTGNGSEVVVKFPEGTTKDQVNVTIDGKDANDRLTIDENGTAKVNLTGIEPGEHNITIKYTDEDGTVSWVNTTVNVPKWSSAVNATAATIREGDPAVIKVKVSPDMQGEVKVVINGTGYIATVDENGEATITAYGLKAGNHTAVVTYLGSDKYEPSNATFKVTVQEPITVKINGTGNSSEVIVKFPEGTTPDQVNVTIDGKDANDRVTIDENGTAKVNLTGIEPGEHNITIKYTDEDGTVSWVNTTVNVPKWSSAVNATAATIREGDVAVINVQMDANETGRVLVNINGTGYYADLKDGKAIINAPGLKAGTYNATVSYEGDKKYDPSNNTFTIVVQAPITINVNGTGNSSEVVVKLPEGANETSITVTVDGNKTLPVTVDENGTARANLTGLEPGEHNITVKYVDPDGTVSYVNTTIDVPRWSSAVNSTAATICEGDVAVINVQMDANETGRVLVDINGTGYYADLKDGKAIINAPGLKAGTYNATVTYEGDAKYDPSNNTFQIIVQAPITIDVNGTGNSSEVVVKLPEGATDKDVNITVDGNKTLPVTVDENGTARANLTGLEPGEHNITVKYVDPDGTVSYVNTTINVPRWSSAVNATAATIREGDDAVIKVKVDSNETGTVYVDIAGTGYYGTLENGEVTIYAPGIKKGKYTGNVTYLGDKKYDPANNTFTLEVQSEITIDLEGAGNSSKVIVQLPEDSEGSNVTVMVDGKEVPVTVDENGTATADLSGLPVGEHNVTVIYKDKDNNTSIASKTVKVYNSINVADEIIRGWNSPYDAEAEFLDKEGHVLANTTVEFTVNGKTYKVMTDEKGIGRLTDSHLDVGKYEATIKNPVTGEELARNVTIVKRLIENKDVTTDYLAGKYYNVKAIGDDGKPVGAGEVIGITVNGVGYVIKTNKDGVGKLKINLVPKKYTIIAEYAKYKVTNKIVVKQTLKLVKKTVKAKKGKKIVIKAKLKWTNGKAIKGKKITIKFKGKKFSAKTNKKGIAKITIKKKSVLKKLKKGKTYKFTAFYVKEKAKGKIKIK